MEIGQFRILTEARFKKCLDLMIGSKNAEYSRNGDKLHNFKQAAILQRCSTPEKALLGMWSKHLVSIIDIVYDLDAEILPDSDVLAEKITDSINYLVLLEALIIERIQAREVKS